jgi:hypothetical protein
MIESMTELTAREGFEEIGRDQTGQVHVERFWPKPTSRDDQLQRLAQAKA